MDDFGAGPVRYALRGAAIQDFAASELFERTFQEGMDLVEQCAAYLDGGGRQDSKLLSRNAALAYAGESMRLTTQLMQVASWLLVQRAVRTGEMAADAASDPRYRLADDAGAASAATDVPIEDLPMGLVHLCERSERLFERVRRLDQRMYRQEPVDIDAPHPVLSQFDRLRDAFNLVG
jgi:regulator of CtrA degradation